MSITRDADLSDHKNLSAKEPTKQNSSFSDHSFNSQIFNQTTGKNSSTLSSDKDLTDQVIEKKMIHPQQIHSSVDHTNSHHQQPEINQLATKDYQQKKINYFSSVEKKAKDLFDKNLFSQAAQILSHLHAKGLGSANTYCTLANCYYQQNQFKHSLLSYKKALELDSSHVESLLNLSLLRFDLGDYSKGSFFYKRANQAIGDHEESQWKMQIAQKHIDMGMMYFQKEYYHEALLEFLKAKPIKKHSIPFELQVIRCLWKLSRKKEALHQLFTLKKANPLDIHIPLLLGEFYFEMKKITDAIHQWEFVLRVDAKNKAAMKWLSKVQYVQSVKEDSFA